LDLSVLQNQHTKRNNQETTGCNMPTMSTPKNPGIIKHPANHIIDHE